MTFVVVVQVDDVVGVVQGWEQMALVFVVFCKLVIIVVFVVVLDDGGASF